MVTEQEIAADFAGISRPGLREHMAPGDWPDTLLAARDECPPCKISPEKPVCETRIASQGACGRCAASKGKRGCYPLDANGEKDDSWRYNVYEWLTMVWNKYIVYKQRSSDLQDRLQAEMAALDAEVGSNAPLRASLEFAKAQRDMERDRKRQYRDQRDGLQAAWTAEREARLQAEDKLAVHRSRLLSEGLTWQQVQALEVVDDGPLVH